MTSPPTLRVLALAAVVLAGCGGRGGESTTAEHGTSTDTGATTATATSSTGADATTMTGGAPTSTGELVTTSDTGTAPGCLGDAECAPDRCVGTHDEACAECRPPSPTCIDDFVCQPLQGCIEFPFACSCDYPFTTGCWPLCATSADCEAGGVCNLDTNHCVYDPCVDDADCPTLFTCVPVLGGDACRRRRCESDGDCGGAVCIEGRCHAAPGTCVPSPF